MSSSTGSCVQVAPATSSRCRSRRCDSCTPSAAQRAPGRRAARAGSAISALSVISSVQQRAAATPCARAALGRRRGQLGVEQVRDRQVDRDADVVAGVAPAGAAAPAPRRRTQSVSGRIRPVCSAIGMNSSAGSQPALGVLPAHQRLDAAERAGPERRPSAGSAARARPSSSAARSSPAGSSRRELWCPCSAS